MNENSVSRHKDADDPKAILAVGAVLRLQCYDHRPHRFAHVAGAGRRPAGRRQLRVEHVWR